MPRPELAVPDSLLALFQSHLRPRRHLPHRQWIARLRNPQRILRIVPGHDPPHKIRVRVIVQPPAEKVNRFDKGTPGAPVRCHETNPPRHHLRQRLSRFTHHSFKSYQLPPMPLQPAPPPPPSTPPSPSPPRPPPRHSARSARTGERNRPEAIRNVSIFIPPPYHYLLLLSIRIPHRHLRPCLSHQPTIILSISVTFSGIVPARSFSSEMSSTTLNNSYRGAPA